MSSQYQIPHTRVISPSPTPSESNARNDYFPPQTRSQKGSGRVSSADPIRQHGDHDTHEEEDPEFSRARSRSRSPIIARKAAGTEMNGGSTTSAKTGLSSTAASRPTRRQPAGPVKGLSNGAKPPNGLLSPASANPQGQQGFGSSYWRNLSRSPSPFGLIPIHREWRDFVHKHEVPRKFLHVSIGFMTLWLYHAGYQKTQIHPVLLSLLIPIFSVDVVRFRWPAFNRLYIRVLGPFMRESEAHDRYNGVISYLAGLWATMYFCRKDVAVMSVLLLSWCDAAASTFGRLWGRYTPRIRKGKSLAGSLAACIFGIASAVLFWGFIAPSTPSHLNTGANSFAFDGRLVLTSQLREAMQLSKIQATVAGPVALGILAIVSGIIVSVAEAVDILGFDDNLTIPILSGIGLGTFLWAFGGT